MVRELPKIMIKGVEYYVDVQMEEFRSVLHPETLYDLDDVDDGVLDEISGEKIVDIVRKLVSSIIELTEDTIITNTNELHQKSSDVSQQEVDELRLVKRLRAANKTAWCEGCGLAAIQIGLPLRFAWGVYRGREFVLHNPEILEKWGLTSEKEGCLSIPNKWVRTDRAVTIKYVSGGKKRKTHKVTGFLARLVQHEIDHMDGILTVDKKGDVKNEDSSISNNQ